MRRTVFIAREACRCSSQSSACSASQKYQSIGPSRSLYMFFIMLRLQHHQQQDRFCARMKTFENLRCSLFRRSLRFPRGAPPLGKKIRKVWKVWKENQKLKRLEKKSNRRFTTGNPRDEPTWLPYTDITKLERGDSDETCNIDVACFYLLSYQLTSPFPVVRCSFARRTFNVTFGPFSD